VGFSRNRSLDPALERVLYNKLICCLLLTP
jgi:hypothetical protein